MTSILDLPTGLHRNVSGEVYHQRHLGLVSNTALKKIARSPLQYKAWVDGTAPDEESPALLFGAAFHCALLEPERFSRAYAAEPNFGDCRRKENKAARDEWRQANAGKAWLESGDMAAIRAMVDSVRAHPLASKMIVGGEAELTLRWTDEETGLPCKSRADYYVPQKGLLVDVKTTEDASPEGFRRSIAKYCYHWQDALYRAGFAAAGAAAQYFVFIAVEKSPPYEVCTYTLDEEGVAKGHDRVRSLMRTIRDCMLHNIWPGYQNPIAIHPLELPKYAA